MYGSSCTYTNYSLKLIIALLEPGGYKLCVTRQDNITPFRINLEARPHEINQVNWQCADGGIYWQSISNTINEMDLNSNKDAWLVLITDGFIDFDPGVNHKIIKDYASNGGRVLWVSTLLSPYKVVFNGLARFFKLSFQKSQLEVFETQADAIKLMEQLANVAARLINADMSGIEKKAVNNEIRVSLKLPTRKLVVIEQNSDGIKPAMLQSILDPKGNNLRNYYGIPFNYEYLYGCVTHIGRDQGSTFLPPGEFVLAFNENMTGRNIKILPIVLVKPSVKLNGNFLSVNHNVYKICKDEKTILVTIEFADEEGGKLSDEILKSLEVSAKYGNNEKEFTRKGKSFEVEIPIREDETSLTISSSMKGYFSFQSEVYKILKEDCKSSEPPVVVKPEEKKMKVKTKWFRKKSTRPKPAAVPDSVVKREQITKTDSGDLHFNLDHPAIRITELDKAPAIQVLPFINNQPVTFNEYPDLRLYQIDNSGLRMQIIKENDFWLVKPHKMVCECLAKTGKYVIQFEMRSGKSGLYPVQSTTIEYEILDAPFWEKCGKFILRFILTILVITYLWGLFKKNRFTNAGQIYYARVSADDMDEINWRNAFLRKNGLSKWFIRWFVPYVPERSSFSFYSYRAEFVAHHSKFIILFPKSMQNDHIFYCGSVLLKPGQEDLQVAENQTLEIRKENYRIIMKYISNKK
jgi:hypothetical protein